MFKYVLVAMFVAGGPALADNDTPNCKEPVTQMDMNICSGIAFGEADAKLNAVWPKYMADATASDKSYVLDSGDNAKTEFKDALLASQRAWLAYRDAQCTWEGFKAHGGSMEALLVNSCKQQLTLDRIEQLEEAGLQ